LWGGEGRSEVDGGVRRRERDRQLGDPRAGGLGEALWRRQFMKRTFYRKGVQTVESLFE
jgi:hypothetical protein